MSDPVRRDVLGALAASMGLAALVTAVPALGQRKPRFEEPRLPRGTPTASSKIATKVWFDYDFVNGPIAGTRLYGQLQERLMFSTSGAPPGASARLIVVFMDRQREVATWVSRPFAMTDGPISLFKSGCSFDRDVIASNVSWRGANSRPNHPYVIYQSSKPSIEELRYYNEYYNGILFGNTAAYAITLLPENGDVECVTALFEGASLGLPWHGNFNRNMGFVRPKWSLPPFEKNPFASTP